MLQNGTFSAQHVSALYSLFTIMTYALENGWTKENAKRAFIGMHTVRHGRMLPKCVHCLCDTGSPQWPCVVKKIYSVHRTIVLPKLAIIFSNVKTSQPSQVERRVPIGIRWLFVLHDTPWAPFRLKHTWYYVVYTASRRIELVDAAPRSQRRHEYLSFFIRMTRE